MKTKVIITGEDRKLMYYLKRKVKNLGTLSITTVDTARKLQGKYCCLSMILKDMTHWPRMSGMFESAYKALL